MIKIFSKTFFIFLGFSLLCSCQPKTVEKLIEPDKPLEATGTSDGGGGDIGKSTILQVKNTIQLTHDNLLMVFSYNERFNSEIHIDGDGDQMTYSEYLRDTYYDFIERYSKQKGLLTLEESHSLLRIVMPRMAWRLQNRGVHYEKKNEPQTPFALDEYFAGHKAKMQEQDSCKAPDKQHPYAAVDSFTLDAQICFSVSLLTQEPYETLEPIIAGLWIHELAHMNGMAEDKAVVAQNAMVRIYSDLVTMETMTFAGRISNLELRLGQALNDYRHAAFRIYRPRSEGPNLQDQFDLYRAEGEARGFFWAMVDLIRSNRSEKACHGDLQPNKTNQELAALLYPKIQPLSQMTEDILIERYKLAELSTVIVNLRRNIHSVFRDHCEQKN